MQTTLVRQAVVALALGAAGVAANALPTFTFNPAAAGLSGAPVTADNLIISDYATVNYTTPTTFSETGYLVVTNYQLGGTTLSTQLGSTYGLYIAFTGAGTLPTASTGGTFSSLSYTLYGYNGTASFTPSSTTATNSVALASGSLIPGSGFTFGTAATGTTAFANVSVNPLNSGFFASPTPFYNVALTTFSNTTSQIASTSNGFTITQGGGAINFISAVPEPETYALMLAGLGVMGFVARRRQVK